MQIQNYAFQSAERGQTLYSFEVTLDASSPALGEGADRGCASIAVGDPGEYTITLSKRWAKVVPVGCALLGDAVELAKISAVVDGSAAENTVKIITMVEDTGVLGIDDPAAARTCVVTLLLQNSKRRL